MSQSKYYGKQTEQALKNFPFPTHQVHLELIYAITEIKKSAALAHQKTKELPKEITTTITQACDEILKGKHDTQFVTCALQGGAGTSINMNINEVIANRASELSGKTVHPNDHVNKSQSTNDVNPSALKIASIKLLQTLQNNLDLLAKSFEAKAKEYPTIKKLARTHIQDAIPTTIGEEFQSYADTLKRNQQKIKDLLPYLYELNLGGTAIGNCLNTSPKYRKEVYHQLRRLTQIPVKPAKNLMSQTSSSSDFCQTSAIINILFTDINKIANDIRFLSSGPRGGIHELTLQPLQAGSSIMPGKINPVIPEAMNQLAFEIAGKNLTIHQAAQNAHLELAIMFPIIADALIIQIKLAATGCFLFATNCIQTLTINEDQCQQHLERSTAYATILTPYLGYDKVSKIVLESINSKKTLREVIQQKQILSQRKLDKLLK